MNTPSHRFGNLVHTVKLRFFQDNANGEWGVTHENTWCHNGGDGFNAFWDGEGLFHDVFEHSQEGVHKWFMGEAFMNLGGEMWAMGALMYYAHTVGIKRFTERGFYASSESAARITLGLLKEAVEDGNMNFGYKLVCDVPYQKRTDDYALENMLDYYAGHKAELRAGKNCAGDSIDAECREYLKSASMRSIRSLHRGGWKWAKALVPQRHENRVMMQEFIAFWRTFCKMNPAENLRCFYRGLTFRLYRNEDDLVNWECDLVPDIGSSIKLESYSSDRLPEVLAPLEPERELSFGRNL